MWFQFCQFSHSVVSDSLQPSVLQHTRLLCFITNSWGLLKLMSIESVMPSNHLILYRPLLFPPSVFPSIRVFFTSVSSLHQVARVFEFQLQHPSFQRTSKVLENPMKSMKRQKVWFSRNKFCGGNDDFHFCTCCVCLWYI